MKWLAVDRGQIYVEAYEQHALAAGQVQPLCSGSGAACQAKWLPAGRAPVRVEDDVTHVVDAGPAL